MCARAVHVKYHKPIPIFTSASESRVEVSQRVNELCEWERVCGRADASS